MATQPGYYYDVIWESTDNAAVAAWFNASGWRGWIPPGQTDDDGNPIQGNRFDPDYITSNWKIKQGQAIIVMRILQTDWQTLAALDPPMASINIIAREDPFELLTFADPENPTLGELYANDVFFKVARSEAKRDILRFYWPRLVNDDPQNIYNRGVRFARFEEGRPDFDAIGET